MTNTTSDPISTTQERVLVRSTATGFEQGIAGVAGFFTAGPVGALAAWGALRGLQGKWAPWFILGIPSAIAINIIQLVIVATVMGAFGVYEEENKAQPTYLAEQATEQVYDI